MPCTIKGRNITACRVRQVYHIPRSQHPLFKALLLFFLHLFKENILSFFLFSLQGHFSFLLYLKKNRHQSGFYDGDTIFQNPNYVVGTIHRRRDLLKMFQGKVVCYSEILQKKKRERERNYTVRKMKSSVAPESLSQRCGKKVTDE